MKKMLLVDAFAVIHRAFHALPDFTAPDGTHVNAVYGFFSTLLKAVRDIKPDYVVVAFDLPGPTVRHEVFEAYKAQRPATPPELSEQVPLVKELVETMGVPLLAKEGFEAEDIIASVIDKSKRSDLEYVIVTGDQDTLQLASDRVDIYFLRKGLAEVTLVDGQKVEELYGVTPKQIIDVKALKGDSSDNVPGVPGIGDKTAVELVKKFGSVERVIAGSSGIPEKVRHALKNHTEQVALAKKLVTIRHDAEIESNPSAFRWSNDNLLQAIPILERYNMQSLIKRITRPSSHAKTKPTTPGPRQDTLL